MTNGESAAIELLRELTQAHGAPGHEEAVRRIVAGRFPKDQLSYDRTGSIIVRRSGSCGTPTVMLAAHMDEVGFMVQSITADGLLRFVPLGGWWSHSLMAQRVRVLRRDGSEVIGVITSTPPHFLERAERENLVPLEKMLIDVGAANAEDARERLGIQPGDVIVPESPFTRMANPSLLLAKAFDNRVGVALGIRASEIVGDDHPNLLQCVGTVQEEVGVRGVRTAAAAANPDVGIVLEGPPADDLPGRPADERQGQLGKGPQVRLFDPTAISNRRLAELVIETARDCDIPCQIAVRSSGGTDARELHLHDIGVPTVVLGIPARYIHTHQSIIDLRDFLHGVQLLAAVIRRLDSATVSALTDYS